jgi:hypothetical protein
MAKIFEVEGEPHVVISGDHDLKAAKALKKFTFKKVVIEKKERTAVEGDGTQPPAEILREINKGAKALALADKRDEGRTMSLRSHR